MKKRTKQMLSMLLAVCMVAMLLPAGAFALEPTPAQLPAESGVVETVGETAEDDAAKSGASGETVPTLNTAQQAFVDAVAALNQEKLVELAAAYKADPTEDTDAAFYAEYDKVEGVDGSAAELYAALSDEEKAADAVVTANATLEGILSTVNAILDPAEEGTPQLLGTEQVTTYGVITPAKPTQGTGTAESPYQITNAAELYWFAALVNGDTAVIGGGVTKNTAACAKLMNDITVNENVLSNGTLNGDGKNFTAWTPIGSDSNPYTGTFDGDGKTVNGLYFNDTEVYFVGLFSYVGNGGTVQNVAVADSWFEANDYVGGVCGANENGTLTNCSNSGTVSAAGDFTYVGGVCGLNEASYGDGAVTLTNCYNTGAVTGSGSGAYVGGVCGSNNVLTGGAITLTNCYNTGALTGGEDANVGGVCGENAGGTFTNCYYRAESAEHDDGLEGTTAKTADQFASGEVAWLLNGSTATAGEGKTLAWYQNLATTGGDTAPVLKKTGSNTVYAGYTYDANGFAASTEQSYSNTAGASTYYQKPAQDENGVYQIKNAGNLYWFAALVNGDTSAATGTGGVAQNTAAKAKLVNTITVNENVLNADGSLNGNADTVAAFRKWTPIGNKSNRYTGTFDGGNNTINGLYFNDESASYIGLFGCVDNGGKMQDVTVADSWFQASDLVGGVCGYNENGILTNCSNAGTVTGTGEEDASVGGVCGWNADGTFTNCTNTGAVSATGESAYVGGVCGKNHYSTLTNCTNSGTVTGTGAVAIVGGVCAINGAVASSSSTLINCTNSGMVSGTDNSLLVGGVCGYNLSSRGSVALTNCINTGAVTGGADTYVGGVCAGNDGTNGPAALTNCYNTGAVTGGTSAISGDVCAINNATLTNCYYQAASEMETDTLDGTTAKTAAQFASGEVAWLLDTAGVVDAHSKVWSQGTASPKFAKADGSDVVYRALFLPKTVDTPVVGTAYLKADATLTAPVGYTWQSDMPTTMPAKDSTYRWTAPVQITTQPTTPAAKNYGYTDTQNLTVVAATALTDKTITYQWKKDGTAIDGATAATYTIPTGLAVGNYVYTCDVTCDGDTVTTTAVTFTVNKAPLTWDVSGLIAQKPYDGNTTATVTGTLKVSGVVGNEDVQFTYDEQSLAGTYDDATVGTGKTVTVIASNMALTGTNAGNYALPTGPITITNGVIANDLPIQPAQPTTPEGAQLKLTMANGISVVPEALQSKPELDTTEKIENALKAEAAKRMPGVPEANIVTKDIELWYKASGDASWTEAEGARFPAEGVTVVVPYTELNLTYAAAQGMDFAVLHMISAGDNAGTIENLPYTLTADGVQCILHSLSPVTVSYKPKTAQSTGGDTTTTAPVSNPFVVNAWVNVLAGGTVSPMGITTYAEGKDATYTITPAAGYRIAKVTVDGVEVGAVNSYTFSGINRDHDLGVYFEKASNASWVNAPATGDNTSIVLWAVLLALAVVGLAAVVVIRKKAIGNRR